MPRGKTRPELRAAEGCGKRGAHTKLAGTNHSDIDGNGHNLFPWCANNYDKE